MDDTLMKVAVVGAALALLAFLVVAKWASMRGFGGPESRDDVPPR